MRNNYKQFIADLYHCSNMWGEKVTEKEMLYELTEYTREKEKDDYCPKISLYKKCAAYWNQLAELYPQ
jgi:exopolyphosphatase/pppGpp-phosphohydrolase